MSDRNFVGCTLLPPATELTTLHMFAQSRPVPFHPYGRKRARWHVPRWLLLLLVGIATGAAGVVVVQERAPGVYMAETTVLVISVSH